MIQEKFEYLGDGVRIYFLDINRLTIDDFLRLENIAAIENYKMQHKIFFIFESLEEKIYTSLN